MSTIELRSCRAGSRRGPVSALVARRDWMGRVQRAVQLLLIWRERAQQRRQLERLNDHMLRDIGLTRADVLAEASKPFWQP
jgi:uncharacterized protein YjiS (DUF1127 family)